MTNTSSVHGTAKPSVIRRAGTALLVALAAILMLGLPALSNSGVADTLAGVHAASASYNEDAHVYNVGGIKRWQCKDPDSGWRAPKRLLKASAVIDCASYNSRA